MGNGRNLQSLESNLGEAYSILNNFADSGSQKRAAAVAAAPGLDELNHFIQSAYNLNLAGGFSPPQKKSSLGRAGNLDELERNLNEAFNIFNELNSKNKKTEVVSQSVSRDERDFTCSHLFPCR